MYIGEASKIDLFLGLSATQEYDDLNKVPYVQIHIAKDGLTLRAIRIDGRLCGRSVINEDGNLVALL